MATPQSNTAAPPTITLPGGGGGGSSSGGGSSKGGGHSAPKHSTAGNFDALSAHQRKQELAAINDVFRQVLGRNASAKEARTFYDQGLSDYGIQQKLMHTKEWLHSGAPMGYKHFAQQYKSAFEQMGVNVALKPKLIAHFAALGYTSTDLNDYVRVHPKLYAQTTEYNDKLSQFQQAYAQAFGLQNVDPTSWAQQVTREHVDTNKKKKGIQGQKFVTHTGAIGSGEEVNAHLASSAQHFNSVGEYQQWLQKQPGYKAYQQQTIQPGQENQDQTQSPLQNEQQRTQTADVGA